MALATVLPVAELTTALLAATLGALGTPSRKIAISLKNLTGSPWEYGSVYYESGTADESLPLYVGAGMAVVFGARKTAGPVATGSVGVITYYIRDRNVTVALMWSVPYDYNLYSNWWNCTVLDGFQQASQDLYTNLYYNWTPQSGDGTWKLFYLDNGWAYRGSMGASATPSLECEVAPRPSE